jgi:membrane-bound lytic murein transglycosylase B
MHISIFKYQISAPTDLFGSQALAFMLFASLALTPTAFAQIEEAEFQTCLVDLQRQARERHMPDWVVDEVIPGLKVQNRVVELDRRQPEFMQTLAQYLAIRLTDARIKEGRRQLRQKEDLLRTLSQKYGIPGQYLMAFWGLETNFGSYLGSMPTLDSLATLACDPRRSGFFSGEFMIALELMQREQLSPDQMQGSWAGAMGHTQFMPSSYMQYAVDGDGDGRIDLWRSEADALTSGANFLSNLGWVPGMRWGREVLLPDGFDYSKAGRSEWPPLADWAAASVLRTNGDPLPQAQIDAALLVPAGAGGPAFLVYQNFEVIMRWNRSESYALSVGLLADAISGSAGLVRKPPEGDGISLADIEKLQLALSQRGFDPGPVDGVWGSATRRALSEFEKSSGRIADGYPDAEVLSVLLPQSP